MSEFVLGQDNPLRVGGGSVAGNAGQSAVGWCEYKTAANKCPNKQQVCILQETLWRKK